MYKWVKGKRMYAGKRNTQTHLAWELLVFSIIKIKGINCKGDYFNIKKSTCRQASNILKKNGWRWEKLTCQEYRQIYGD